MGTQQGMNSVRCLVSLLCAGLVVAGCSPATTTQSTGQTTTTTSSESVRAACADVADKTGVLFAVVGRFATGDATVEQVRSAAADLSGSFDDAMASAGPDVRGRLDEAGQALTRVQDALSTDPIDSAALRTAANDLFSALGNAADVCTPGSSSTSTEDSSTSTEDTTENSVTTLSTS
jgi:hypothetical protein